MDYALFHQLFAAFYPGHIGLAFAKVASLYLPCVSKIAFSSSCTLRMQFRRGIFNSSASCNNISMRNCFSCNPKLGLKEMSSAHLLLPTLKIFQHQLNHSACYICASVFLNFLTHIWRWKFLHFLTNTWRWKFLHFLTRTWRWTFLHFLTHTEDGSFCLESTLYFAVALKYMSHGAP